MMTQTDGAAVEANRALGRRFFEEQDRLRGGPAGALCAPGYRAEIGGNPPMDFAGHEAFARAFYTAFDGIRHDIEEVFANMKGLLAAKKELNSRTPFVEWQFIVFKHNEHQMDKARQLAAEWGVDLLRFVAPGFQPESMDDRNLREKWMPKDPLFSERNPAEATERGYIYDRTCFYLYRSMSIYPGGGVTPCCFTHDRKQDFGDILNSTVAEIWNNHHYRSARMLFNNRLPQEERSQVVCDLCPIFHQARERSCSPNGRSFGTDHASHAGAHAE